MNANQAQITDFRDNISNYLKNVLPLGDGLYGSRTTPFSEFVGKFYNPANFANMYDYSYNMVSDLGKPISIRPYKMIGAENIGNSANVLDDLVNEVFNYTVTDDTTALIRNLIRSNYVAAFPRNDAGTYCESDINSFNTNNDPKTVLSLLSRMAPIAMVSAEKDTVAGMLNNGLFDMLNILKASGNMNAYKLALKLCNVSESYFALASAVNNMVNASLQIVPQVAMNSVQPGRSVNIGAVDMMAPVVDQNMTLSLQQMVQRYVNDINSVAQYLNNSPQGVNLYNNLVTIGSNLPEPVLNNIHAIVSGGLIDPNLAYTLNIDEALTIAVNAQSNLYPHMVTVLIAYILLTVQGQNASAYLSGIGIQVYFSVIPDILTSMSEDIKFGEIVRTVLCARNPSNGNLGKILDHYIKTSLANRKPVRLQDVLQYTKSTTGNTTNSVTVRDVANYLQAMEPQFYGIANPESLMMFADILYNLKL